MPPKVMPPKVVPPKVYTHPQTPGAKLWAACREGDLYAVRELIEKSHADPNAHASTSTGSTALHEAMLAGHREVVQVLLAAGALVSPRDSHGNTPLHACAASSIGDEPVLTYTPCGGRAVCAGCARVRELSFNRGCLRRRAARSGRRARIAWAWRTLRVAYRSTLAPPGDDPELAAQLLASPHCDSRAVNSDGATALHLAALRAKPETARLLVEHGTPLDALDRHGRDALTFAARAAC